MFTTGMNPLELSVRQLKRAATIKARIEALNKELQRILGGSDGTGSVAKPKRTMSASAKKKIAAAQRARWAKIKASKTGKRSGKSA